MHSTTTPTTANNFYKADSRVAAGVFLFNFLCGNSSLQKKSG